MLEAFMSKQQKNLVLLCSLLISCVFVWTVPANAESIFLKDGRIIEGDIIKETDKAMDVKLPDGKKMTIPRKDIMRTLVQDSYKTKMYIMKADKTVLPVYIVEEDNESYTCRIDLQSPEEFHINKSEVLFVSKVPPQAFIEDEAKKLAGTIKKDYTWEQKLTWRAPLLRAGFSVNSKFDDEVEYLFEDEKPVLLLDFFPWRFRNENGNGLDLMIRFRYTERDTNDEQSRRLIFQQLYNNINIVELYDATFYSTSICAGIRYAYTFYIGITLQPYIFVLGQWSQCGSDISFSNGTNTFPEEYKTTSFGYQLGAGIDFGLWSYVGVFVEYAYGYATLEFPNGKKYNGDGQFVYIGASYRTSYGLIE